MDRVLTKCPICGNQVGRQLPDDRDIYQVPCPICGQYKATEEAVEMIRTEKGLRNNWNLISGTIRNLNETGKTPYLRTDNIEDLIASATPPVSPLDAVDAILIHIHNHTPFYGEPIPVPLERMALTYSKNFKEFENYLDLAIELGYLMRHGDKRDYSLTHKGWQRVGDIRSKRPHTNQAFVAMWFCDDLRSVWEQGFKPALEQVGYSPIRVDLLEHNEKIDDLIVAEIRRSSLLVADFTGGRGGVYFEAGLAMGLGIPLIWTCRSDDVEKLHFDTRQYNHIVWATAIDLREKLVNRIQATVL